MMFCKIYSGRGRPPDVYPYSNAPARELRSQTAKWFGIANPLVTLLRSGLPATPGTALYLLSKIGEAEEALPTRGLLIKSFSIRRPEPYTDGMITRMVYSVPWITRDILKQAQTKASEHNQWWAARSNRVYDAETRGNAINTNMRSYVELYLAGTFTRPDFIAKACSDEVTKLGHPLSDSEKRVVSQRVYAAISNAEKNLKILPQ